MSKLLLTFLIKLCSLTTLMIFIQSPSLAGVVFEIEVKDHATNAPAEEMEISVEGRNLKMEIPASKNRSSSISSSAERAADAAADTIVKKGNKGKQPDDVMIYRADRKEMVIVDHESKEYFIIDQAFLTRIQGQFAGASKQMATMNSMMQQAYKTAIANLDAQNLSPQDRAVAEQMIKNTMGMASMPTTKSSDTLKIIKGKKGKVNDYPVVDYELHQSGKKLKEIRVADWDDLGDGAKAKDTIDSFFGFFNEMGKNSKKMGFGSGKGRNFYEAMDKIGGFPVVVRSFEGGELDEETVLKSVTERDLDPDAFEPPKGYRLRTMGF